MNFLNVYEIIKSLNQVKYSIVIPSACQIGVSFQGGDMGSRGNHPDFFCSKSCRTSDDLFL
jgi:hypothetical protein